jgi:hypothetical protein
MSKPIKFKASSGNSLRASITKRTVNGEPRAIVDAGWKYPPCQADIEESRETLLAAAEEVVGMKVTRFLESQVEDEEQRASMAAHFLGVDQN